MTYCNTDDTDPVALLAGRSVFEQTAALRRLSDPVKRELIERWWRFAHDGQFWPPGDWHIWLILAGRGFGKTRAGAEWVSEMARRDGDARIALVGATVEEVRKVMVEGPAGLLAVARDGEEMVWSRERGELRFPSGAIATAYSADTPEALRGPEHHFAWCDELAKWRRGRGEVAWDNLMLGLRGGEAPRVLVTTTPRAVPLVRRVEALALADGTVTRGRTLDNLHLPDSFVAAMVAEYGGKLIGRQELDGEIVDQVEGALWNRAMLEECRVKRRRVKLARVVVGVDPPASSGGDACGIVAAGLGADGVGYVLEDASVVGASPDGWARAVAACAARHKAERVVAEKNQGGDMVAAVLKAADARLPLKLVHASRGKVARAEPVATLYEGGRVRHVGEFRQLEDELCGLMTAGAYEGPGRSPDRADALVWALSALMLERRGKAAVRAL